MLTKGMCSCCFRAEESPEAKITQLNNTLSRDEDIGWLYICTKIQTTSCADYKCSKKGIGNGVELEKVGMFCYLGDMLLGQTTHSKLSRH
jgi:hypothetical protein